MAVTTADTVPFETGERRVGIIKGSKRDYPVEFTVGLKRTDFDNAYTVVDSNKREWAFSVEWPSRIAKDFPSALWGWYGDDAAKQALTAGKNRRKV